MGLRVRFLHDSSVCLCGNTTLVFNTGMLSVVSKHLAEMWCSTRVEHLAEMWCSTRLVSQHLAAARDVCACVCTGAYAAPLTRA